MFYIIDSNKSGVISLPELVDANEKFELGLTDTEMEVMINYPGCEDAQKIKVKTLYELIGKHNQVPQ